MSTTEPTTLREHIQAEEAETQGGTGAPADPVQPETPPVEAVPQLTADQEAETEADSTKPDAELSEAGRTMRRSRRDERIKRLRAENAELNEELRVRKALRDALDRTAPGPPRPAGGPPADRLAHADPHDPAPKEDDFTDYGSYLEEKARWAARDEFRKQQAAGEAKRVRSESERRRNEHAAKLDTAHEVALGKYADAQVVIDHVLARLRSDDPRRSADLVEYLGELDEETVGDIVYRLGKDAEAEQKVFGATSKPAMFRALASVEQALTSPKPAAPVTRAPAPPRHLIGGGASTAPTPDTTKPGTALKDHIRVEEAEIAERRRAGYRY